MCIEAWDTVGYNSIVSISKCTTSLSVKGHYELDVESDMEKNRETTYPPHSILVAIDGSEYSMRAARYAGELAASTKARVTLVHAVLVPPMASEEAAKLVRKDLSTKAESFLREAVKNVETNGVAVDWKVVETDTSVVKAVIDFADSTHAGLIVTGTRGVSGYGKMVLGSVAAGVVGFAHCPVLTVR